MNFIFKFYRFFCSLSLAVSLMCALAVLLAVGTFYESLYGANAAQEVIYQSIWITLGLLLLALNITAVMIDRWPWQKKHIAFLTAHFGILFVCTGALMTRYLGADGNVRVLLGKTAGHIVTSDILLSVYSSFDGQNLTELYTKKPRFFISPPTPAKPYQIPLGQSVLKVTGYYPHATAAPHYKKADKGGPAVRFFIKGRQAEVVSWLFKPSWKQHTSRSLGPAQVVLTSSFKHYKANNSAYVLLLTPFNKTHLKYKLYQPAQKTSPPRFKQGVLKIGSILKTGWMDFEFHLLAYWPHAQAAPVWTPQKQANNNTTSAIQVEFKGSRRWLGLNSHLVFFEKNKMFAVAYINGKKKLNFNIKLNKFNIRRYPSSQKAASYESEVAVCKGRCSPAAPVHVISMNNPLRIEGWTIYQSGFEEDEQGRPTASVFAVNKDPGRWFKYIGSFLIVLGCLLLFLRRKPGV